MPLKLGAQHAQYKTVAKPLQNQLSFTSITIAATVVIAGSVIAYTTSSSQPLKGAEPAIIPPSVEERETMPGEPLPGRPGNLTAEEEIKLKKFWKAVYKVFGIQASESEADDLLDEADEQPTNGTAAPAAKDKKKKRNIFSRKKKDKDKEKAKEKSGADAAEDDKYGQTKEFFEALASNSPEDLHRTFWQNVKGENPDGLLLRFLRARKWDIEKAMVMMVSTMQWRQKEMNVEEDIVLGGELAALKDSKGNEQAKKKEGEDFLMQLRKGKSYVHGVDKEGRPVTIVRVKLHHGGDQSESSIARFTVHVFETTRLLLEPPADTGVSILSIYHLLY